MYNIGSTQQTVVKTGFDPASHSSPHNFDPAIAQPKIIAIVNQKGGCGKTTSAINIAAALAARGKRVLLIDTDPQGQAGLGLGIDGADLQYSIYDVFVNGVDLEQVIHSSRIENLYVVPANALLSGAQLEMTSVLGREVIFKSAVNKYATTHRCDYIIIDCSPTLNLITVNALVAAEHILVPFQTHYFSLEGMRELFHTFDTVKERLNTDLNILGIFVTLFDKRIKMNHDILKQVRGYFKEMIFNTVIHMDVKLCEAPIYKKSIFQHAPASRAALEYDKLTKEIMYRIQSLTEQIPEIF